MGNPEANRGKLIKVTDVGVEVADIVNSTWDDLKLLGSAHYKTGGVEPIDLYRAIKPHPSYNTFDIKALTDVMKYAHRLLVKGFNASDVKKINHYMALYEADCIERGE